MTYPMIKRLAAVTLAVGSFFMAFAGDATSMAATLPPAPYTVKAGDTPATIARLSGFGVARFDLVNHLASPNVHLIPGEKVALPFLYRVSAGDTLSYLAQHYGTTVARIMALNHLHSSLIYAGQILLFARGSAAVQHAAHPLVFRAANVSTNAKAPIKQGLGTFLASAYDPSVSSNGPWGAVDYFGQPLKFGDVAVDPSVIPLGSTLYISGYSDPALPAGGFYAKAVDTGGAIKGKRIDVFLPTTSAALNFGLENVSVSIIRK
ncbi:LysM peptidoglycan-binding domain-containing protein [Ferroacidibacillus organovorans]|uniref:LysM domain-containing protein n=1 Tax=Ferroacidibacillus organovorans TaxID=1765683 RepID=A0A117SXP4_9BACL|nr:LysM peptidoglycan-binding domain-containing protein [Ferroacidibacillus organovorans]KUO95763.1 hypothetical protein ATW55_05380 [Ferroacidibacillus organovorans]